MELAQQPHAFPPAEAHFHQLALALTDREAGVARRAAIDRAAAPAGVNVTRNMRRDAQPSDIRNEVVGIVPLVGAQRATASTRFEAGHHLKRGIAFGVIARRADIRLHDEPMPVLHQHARLIGEHRARSRILLRHPRVRIGHGAVRGVASLFSPEVDRRVARIVVGGGRRGRRIDGADALLTRPGLEECPIHGEMLVREQAMIVGHDEHLIEERLGDVAVESNRLLIHGLFKQLR